MDKLLLRVTEAADLASLGRSKGYSLVREGVWPAIRIGKSVRISRSWLERWVEDQTAAALAEADEYQRGPAGA